MFIQPFLTAAQKYVINGTNFVLKPPAYCDLAILSKRLLLLFSYSGITAYLWRMFSHLETAEEVAILSQHPLLLGLLSRSFLKTFFKKIAGAHCLTVQPWLIYNLVFLSFLLYSVVMIYLQYFLDLAFFNFQGQTRCSIQSRHLVVTGLHTKIIGILSLYFWSRVSQGFQCNYYRSFPGKT